MYIYVLAPPSNQYKTSTRYARCLLETEMKYHNQMVQVSGVNKENDNQQFLFMYGKVVCNLSLSIQSRSFSLKHPLYNFPDVKY